MAGIFDDVIEIVHLNPQNAVFYMKGDFLAVKTVLPGKDDDEQEQDRGIIKLRRMFPFEELWTHISVMDSENNEIGIIDNVDDFPECKELLVNELEKIYFYPRITKIYSMKEKYGFSSWDVETDIGRITFSVKDTFRSILLLGSSRAIITDADGGRYEIPDTTKLDRSSYRKIELYV